MVLYSFVQDFPNGLVCYPYIWLLPLSRPFSELAELLRSFYGIHALCADAKPTCPFLFCCICYGVSVQRLIIFFRKSRTLLLMLLCLSACPRPSSTLICFVGDQHSEQICQVEVGSCVKFKLDGLIIKACQPLLPCMDQCHYKQGNKHNGTFCCCNSDLCNRAPTTSAYKAATNLFIFVSTAFSFFW